MAYLAFVFLIVGFETSNTLGSIMSPSFIATTRSGSLVTDCFTSVDDFISDSAEIDTLEVGLKGGYINEASLANYDNG